VSEPALYLGICAGPQLVGSFFPQTCSNCVSLHCLCLQPHAFVSLFAMLLIMLGLVALCATVHVLVIGKDLACLCLWLRCPSPSRICLLTLDWHVLPLTSSEFYAYFPLLYMPSDLRAVQVDLAIVIMCLLCYVTSFKWAPGDDVAVKAAGTPSGE
jgi:hypothetical protein